jgi:hypothetical protein
MNADIQIKENVFIRITIRYLYLYSSVIRIYNPLKTENTSGSNTSQKSTQSIPQSPKRDQKIR